MFRFLLLPPLQGSNFISAFFQEQRSRHRERNIYMQNIYSARTHAPLLNLFQATSSGGGITLAPWGSASCQPPRQSGKQSPTAAASLAERCCRQRSASGLSLSISALSGCEQISPHPDCKRYIQLLLPNSSRSLRDDACHTPIDAA